MKVERWRYQPGVYLKKEDAQRIMDLIDECCIEIDDDASVSKDESVMKLQYSCCLNTDEARESMVKFLQFMGIVRKDGEE